MAYLDSSAFVKLPLDEPEREALRAELARWEGHVSSALLAVEAVRACARHGPAYVADAEARLTALALVPLDDGVLAAAARLAPPALRTLDALHLATALSLGPDLGVLVTYDDRLAAAARDHGTPVARPTPD